MSNTLVLLAKDLLTITFYMFCVSILLYFISHLLMAIYKTLFFDPQIRLIKQLEKVLSNGVIKGED